jgi:hypothetical protein
MTPFPPPSRIIATKRLVHVLTRCLHCPGLQVMEPLMGRLCRSCRTLHGSFAVDNNDHCPHMSFAPQYDVACNVKCQESKSTPDDEVFLQVTYFAAFSQQAIGLGLDQYKTPSIFGWVDNTISSQAFAVFVKRAMAPGILSFRLRMNPCVCVCESSRLDC